MCTRQRLQQRLQKIMGTSYTLGDARGHGISHGAAPQGKFVGIYYLGKFCTNVPADTMRVFEAAVYSWRARQPETD